MLHFVNHFRGGEYPLASLTSFRPDFYRKMGFGYGSKWYEYRVRPSDIPSGWSKEGVSLATKRDFKAKAACYDRVAAKTHGMFRKCRFETFRWDVWPSKMVLYRSNRRVEGYLHFKPHIFDQDNPFFQDWLITEFVYENRTAFQALMAFLHSESDQVNHLVFGNQDSHFHFLPHDPRDHSNKAMRPSGHQIGVQGLGIMYRVLDVARLFRLLKNHDFGGQTCKLKVEILDSFIPDNAGTYLIDFDSGRPSVKKSGRADVRISMDIAEFSSMVLGVVDFYDLYQYGLAEISEPAMINKVDRLFKPNRRPITLTQF
jgi:predicted acetyltransferase